MKTADALWLILAAGLSVWVGVTKIDLARERARTEAKIEATCEVMCNCQWEVHAEHATVVRPPE